MGLDMYAYKTLDAIDTPVDFDVATALQVHYWRKHPNLHGWMEALYYEKGGKHEFNCAPVLLTAEDLDQLESDLRAGELPPTSGFFFGVSDGSENEDDLAFVAAAREAIAAGWSVYYNSWW